MRNTSALRRHGTLAADGPFLLQMPWRYILSREAATLPALGALSDTDFAEAQRQYPQAALRSKEELFYYRIFREQFGEGIPSQTVGRTRSVTKSELN